MHPCPCAHCLSAGQAAKLPHSLPGSASVLGFATPSQARQCIWPYRVHHFLNYGLVVRFRLPSTPPLDDAVAFSYGQPVFCPTGTFTPLLVRTFRRTEGRALSRPIFWPFPRRSKKKVGRQRPSLPRKMLFSTTFFVYVTYIMEIGRKRPAITLPFHQNDEQEIIFSDRMHKGQETDPGFARDP